MNLSRLFLVGLLLPLNNLLAAPPEGMVAKDEKVKELATNMVFTEGPVWIAEKNMLLFSDIPKGVLMSWSEKDGLKVDRPTKNANGNILDAKGLLLTCQHSGRNVIRTEKDGKITVLADKHDGKKLNSPNDLALHSDGSIWFTDPSYGLGRKKSDYDGKWVFRLDEKTGKTSVIYKDFDMPNGIVFSPDYKTVYISDSGRIQKIRAFSIKDGALDKQLFEIPLRCDGMCVDTEGNIYTTSRGGIHVFDNTGKKLGLIETPAQPTNVCFGGKDFDTLFITTPKSLYSIKTLKKGMK